jgi:TPR repeat protein
MVDPVLAEDGNTYERSAILKWLRRTNKSPLNPSQILHPDRLVSNRALLSCIEKTTLSSAIDADLNEDWGVRKKISDLEKAQQLFDEGKVLEAAKLGHPKAQGEMAKNYYSGIKPYRKNPQKCFEFAKQAAEGGDPAGWFRLGWAYFRGEGADKDFVAALKWWQRLAEQGSPSAMTNIGCIYEEGGP